MAKGIRYSEEFKKEAVNQVVHHNYPVAEVAERLGISSKTLYNWVRTFSQPPNLRNDMNKKVCKLKLQSYPSDITMVRYLKFRQFSIIKVFCLVKPVQWKELNID